MYYHAVYEKSFENVLHMMPCNLREGKLQNLNGAAV